jgi:hypothetical protein
LGLKPTKEKKGRIERKAGRKARGKRERRKKGREKWGVERRETRWDERGETRGVVK